MYNLFRHRALFTGSAFFVLGLALGRALAPAAGVVLAGVFFVLGLLFALLLGAWKRSAGSQWQERSVNWRFLAVAAVALGLGMGYLLLHTRGMEDIERRFEGRRGQLTGRVASPIETTTRGSARFELAGARLDGQQIPGRVRIYVEAEQVQALRTGDLLRMEQTELSTPSTRRNPGGVDARANAWTRRAALLAAPEQVTWTGHRASPMDGVLKVRAALLRALQQGMDEQSFGALQGMLFGDSGGMEEEWLTAYRATGIAHVLSVSGLHVGIVSAALAWLFGKLKRRRLGLCGSLLGVLFYCAMCGFSPPVLRSALLCAFLTLGNFLGEKTDSLTALGGAALLILLWNPFVLFGASFPLSFSAVLGIVLLMPPMKAAWARLPWKGRLAERLGDALSSSLAAQLGLLPVQLQVFGTWPLLSTALNLVVIPLSTVAVLTGLVGALLGCIHPVLGALPCMVAALAVRGMSALALWVATLRGAVWTAGALPVWALLALGLVLLALWKYAKNWHWRAGFALAGVLLFVGGWALGRHQAQQRLEMVFLDVGQGDAAYIQQGESRILIDGGAKQDWPDGQGGRIAIDYGETVLLPYLRHRGIAAIDAVVVSHGDADHCGGLIAVLETLHVGALITGPDDQEEDGFYKELLTVAQRRGVPHIRLKQGDALQLGQARAAILWPESWQGNGNESSLVVDIAFAGRRALFTGDIGEAAERQLAGQLGAVDVLKVGHHGSAGSSSLPFVQELQPQIGIISAGKNNRYGHPSPQALERLWTAGVDIWSTVDYGAIGVEVAQDGTLRLRSTRPGAKKRR